MERELNCKNGSMGFYEFNIRFLEENGQKIEETCDHNILRGAHLHDTWNDIIFKEFISDFLLLKGMNL